MISPTRCSNCKTIRIGGGYIILDGDGDDDENRKRGNQLAGISDSIINTGYCRTWSSQFFI